MMALIYKGKDGAHSPGIPARDLTDEDLDRLITGGLFNSIDEAIQALTARGLYSEVKSKRRKKTDEPTDKIDEESDGL